MGVEASSIRREVRIIRLVPTLALLLRGCLGCVVSKSDVAGFQLGDVALLVFFHFLRLGRDHGYLREAWLPVILVRLTQGTDDHALIEALALLPAPIVAVR